MKRMLLVVSICALVGCASQPHETYGENLAETPMPTDAAGIQHQCAWIRSEITRMRNIQTFAPQGPNPYMAMAMKAQTNNNIADLESRAADMHCAAAFSNQPVPIRENAPLRMRLVNVLLRAKRTPVALVPSALMIATITDCARGLGYAIATFRLRARDGEGNPARPRSFPSRAMACETPSDPYLSACAWSWQFPALKRQPACRGGIFGGTINFANCESVAGQGLARSIQ